MPRRAHAAREARIKIEKVVEARAKAPPRFLSFSLSPLPVAVPRSFDPRLVCPSAELCNAREFFLQRERVARPLYGINRPSDGPLQARSQARACSF